jgi:hypothetical protein
MAKDWTAVVALIVLAAITIMLAVYVGIIAFLEWR